MEIYLQMLVVQSNKMGRLKALYIWMISLSFEGEGFRFVMAVAGTIYILLI